jgi:molecular chaperone GrpE
MTGHEDDKRDEAEGREEPKVHDKRRIDPVTGEPRESASAGSGAAPASGVDASAQAGEAAAAPEREPSDDLSEADRALLEGEAEAIDAERAALLAKSEQQQDELARLKADYVNYRNRTERERAGDRDATIASVITSLLPALDDLDLADKHGDLAEGPLAIVAQKLRASFEQLGVVKLGAVGEAFDIDKHEAVAQLPNPEVTEMVVADVVQPGYRVGERMLRAAKVAVFVPAE